MKKTIYTCDRCGAEIEADDVARITWQGNWKRDERKLELCPDCFQVFFETITVSLKQQEEIRTMYERWDEK